MPATLKNISNTPVTVILDHAAFLNTKSGWRRSTATFANMADDGSRAAREVRRSYPGSLTIQPGQEISDLHPAIARCAQVPNLVARKILSVTVLDEPTEQPEKKEPQEALKQRGRNTNRDVQALPADEKESAR
jgi:hypothetical protein